MPQAISSSPPSTMTTTSTTTTPTMMLKQRHQQQPAKSILKPSTSTIGVKRKKAAADMDLPSDIPATPPSDLSGDPDADAERRGSGASPPRKKRARVKFEMDDEPKTTTMTPPTSQGSGGTSSGAAAAPAAHLTKGGEKSTALVREEVRRAIQRHLAGDSEAYDRIKDIFTADPKAVEDDGTPVYELPTRRALRNHLLGLLANVSALDATCNGLVYAVLASEWVGRDDDYVRLFVKFLGTLAAARGAYLNSVLKMLMGYLQQIPRGVRALPGYAVVHTSEVYRRVHLAIKYIVQLIPAGSVALAPLLSSCFPHDADKAKSHIAYTRNLIKIIDYAPELRADILSLITEKLVKTDVQIQVDMEDFEEELGEDILQSMSTAESVALADGDECDDEDDESATSDDGGDLDAESERAKLTKENFQKVDYMMDMLFEYYARPFESDSLADQESTLDMLIGHFRNIILPTYRSRHTQFLLFHFAQASPILIDRFATTCIELAFSKSQPTLMRQYAAAYLASFVARGAHVPSEVVRDVFDLLGNQLRGLMSEYEPSCRGPDLRRYGTFYSTAQALLYIFCFRWRDLTTAAMEEETGPAPDLELDDVSFPVGITDIMRDAIASPLNPLKICSPDIVNEFARLSHHLSFLYVHSKLETNKRVRVQPFRGGPAGALNTQFGQIERETRADDDRGFQLDAYFPFDPYRPRRSGRWLEGDYIHYRGIPGQRGRDEDGQDDDDTDDSRGGDEGQFASDTDDE